MSEQADVSIVSHQSIAIDGVNVDSIIESVEIYQDIFLPVWSMKARIIDTQNAMITLPILIGSKLSVSLESDFPEKVEVQYDFIITEISNRVQLKQDVTTYEITGVSPEYVINESERISKAFSGKQPHEIVSEILDISSIGKLVEFDVDSNRYTHVIPNRSPFAAIHTIASKSVHNKFADFCFYMSDSGEFKYRSLSRMIDDKSGVEFSQQNPNRYDKQGNIKTDTFFNIESYEFVSHSNAISNMALGYFGSRVVSHDIIHKRFSYHNISDKTIHQDDHEYSIYDMARLGNMFNSSVVYQAGHIGKYGDGTKSLSDTMLQWIGSRRAAMRKHEENRFVMAVPGNTAHFALLGRQIAINLDSLQDVDKSMTNDPVFSGAYCASAIRHIIRQGSYKCIFECSKKRTDSDIRQVVS